MRPGTAKVETNGSYWWFDEAGREYLRSPKVEAPRENEWGGPAAGALQDLVWHPYESWELFVGAVSGRTCLRIDLPDGSAITAPGAIVEIQS